MSELRERVLTDTPQAAFSAALAAARTREPGAALLLAQMYMEGKGVVPDPESALLWYTVAAGDGDRLAMNMVGRCHELGLGTSADPALAATWYRLAAEHGLDWGMYNYANLLATGRGVGADPRRAFELYLQAAGMGHAKSMNLVGRHLEEGIATDSDPIAAVDWYRRAAVAGDFRGQASYASILLQRGDVDQACGWLERALEHGSPNFLSKTLPELAAAAEPRLRELASRHAERIAAVTDARDQP